MQEVWIPEMKTSLISISFIQLPPGKWQFVSNFLSRFFEPDLFAVSNAFSIFLKIQLNKTQSSFSEAVFAL